MSDEQEPNQDPQSSALRPFLVLAVLLALAAAAAGLWWTLAPAPPKEAPVARTPAPVAAPTPSAPVAPEAPPAPKPRPPRKAEAPATSAPAAPAVPTTGELRWRPCTRAGLAAGDVYTSLAKLDPPLNCDLGCFVDPGLTQMAVVTPVISR